MVHVERDGPVTTVILDRPEVRNAVGAAPVRRVPRAGRGVRTGAEGPPARAPAGPSRPSAAGGAGPAAVWRGAGAPFGPGAALKAMGGGRGNRLDAAGDGPMGPTR